MKRPIVALLILFLADAAIAQIPAPVLQPESGFWWNSAEPGRGYSIEIQNRKLFMSVYTYAGPGEPDSGTPQWFTVTGDLEGQIVQSELVLSESGQCLGCPFHQPASSFTGRGVTLAFDSDRTGQLTIEDETIPIERFVYTATLAQPISRMLGQWKVITDYSELDDGQYPYEADVLVLNELANNGMSATGNRPGTASPVIATLEGEFILIRVAESADRDLIYRVLVSDLGTDRFTGSSERVAPQASATGLGYPVEAFRAADRTFVERQSASLDRN